MPGRQDRTWTSGSMLSAGQRSGSQPPEVYSPRVHGTDCSQDSTGTSGLGVGSWAGKLEAWAGCMGALEKLDGVRFQKPSLGVRQASLKAEARLGLPPVLVQPASSEWFCIFKRLEKASYSVTHENAMKFPVLLEPSHTCSFR